MGIIVIILIIIGAVVAFFMWAIKSGEPEWKQKKEWCEQGVCVYCGSDNIDPIMVDDDTLLRQKNIGFFMYNFKCSSCGEQRLYKPRCRNCNHISDKIYGYLYSINSSCPSCEIEWKEKL